MPSISPKNSEVDTFWIQFGFSPEQFDAQAQNLATQFVKNFEKFAEGTSNDILNASPRVMAN